jgi:hypothetical protein
MRTRRTAGRTRLLREPRLLRVAGRSDRWRCRRRLRCRLPQGEQVLWQRLQLRPRALARQPQEPAPRQCYTPRLDWAQRSPAAQRQTDRQTDGRSEARRLSCSTLKTRALHSTAQQHPCVCAASPAALAWAHAAQHAQHNHTAVHGARPSKSNYTGGAKEQEIHHTRTAHSAGLRRPTLDAVAVDANGSDVAAVAGAGARFDASRENGSKAGGGGAAG